MDNQNTPPHVHRGRTVCFVLILVLMDNQNTCKDSSNVHYGNGVLILVLMDIKIQVHLPELSRRVFPS